ncbi:hypothetical protein K474DRAFT_1649455 [Panus rudis PR-1116 ss-1]|nr:hypothetical protein K474DRAFT_1649455 [Panus rudis PR-1116 ss-1]
MFNAPRPAQPYATSSANSFGGGGSSFVVDNPLASSVYDPDGLDPWSTAPSPAPPAIPTSSVSAPTGFSAVIADSIVPSIYHEAFATVDSSGSGETSVNGLSRVLGTSGLSASTIDRIVSMVSSRPRVSKLEFFVALALAALAQQDKEISVERVAALAQDNALPVPTLDLSSLIPSSSGFGGAYQPTPPPIRAPVPTRGYSADDPWSISRLTNPPTDPASGGVVGTSSITNGITSSISGTGLPRDWWKKQDTVNVNILGQQGFILNRYLVYEVATERAAPVPRRYSEFVFLWDVLVKRYPFRLLPQLPPKRIGPDESFIEQRRRGLARFLNFVMQVQFLLNHPVIKDDGLLQVFLTEPSFEHWRKQATISYDEESTTKFVDSIEEMSIPSDLDDKLAVVRQKIGTLIEQWQKICILAERIIKRREAVAVRLPSSFQARPHNPAHLPFSFPSLSSPSTSTSTSSSMASNSNDAAETRSLASSVLSSLHINFPHRAPGSGGVIGVGGGAQADTARLTNTLRALVEVNQPCWRGEDCELCGGVRHGLSGVADHTQRHADAMEERSRRLLYTTLEGLKSQRDLYIATRDLFIRHDRLSGDSVDKLKKRVETNSAKLETVRQNQKEGWHEEADKLAGLIEKDQASIAAFLNRRVFIRASMWHELRVVLHNRENTLLTQAVKTFAKEESAYSETVASNWASLVEAVENMPFE